MAPVKVLASTETTGSEFRTGGGLVAVTMYRHAGGTWTLQMQSPSSTVWIPLTVTFAKVDSFQFQSIASYKYRLTGGTVGAEAEVVEVGKFGGNPEGA